MNSLEDNSARILPKWQEWVATENIHTPP